MILDVLLAVLLLSYAVTGYRQGLLVSTMSLVGFLSGGALGMWLLPQLLQRWNGVGDNVLWHTVLLVFGVFVLASIGQGLAVSVGTRLRRQVRLKPARVVDAFLGGVASLVAVSILVWFVAGAVRGGAPAPLARAIGSSRILQTIDQAVPAQTTQLFAGFRALLDREGFPRVFDGRPGRADPLGGQSQRRGHRLARAWPRPAASVVKITGVAAACNRGQEGSGWVVSPGRVVTNAHVVAGMALAARAGRRASGGRTTPGWWSSTRGVTSRCWTCAACARRRCARATSSAAVTVRWWPGSRWTAPTGWTRRACARSSAPGAPTSTARPAPCARSTPSTRGSSRATPAARCSPGTAGSSASSSPSRWTTSARATR